MQPMKTILLTLTLTLGLLPGLVPKAEAQRCGQSSQVYIHSYKKCGTPVYRVRYIAGYDRCGYAIWKTRSLNRHERNHYYQRSYQYRQPRYSGYGQSRITYSSSGGRHYSYSYNMGYSSRCRSW